MWYTDSTMQLTNNNVRELAAKGMKIVAVRPKPDHTALGCTKSCCTELTERYTVERVTRFKDGRTRVFIISEFGYGCTLAYPMSAAAVKSYNVVS
jgi:hypothetical protein